MHTMRAGYGLAVVVALGLAAGCQVLSGLTGLEPTGTGGSGGGTSSSSVSGTGGEGGSTCTPNAKVGCYTGPAGTLDKGICKAGEKVCNAQGTGFGACVGEMLPAATEDCGTPQDENCDGEVNELCPCVAGTMEACYTGPMGTAGTGTCKSGTHTCNADGMGYGPCVGEVVPVPENCATAEDEDCDGQAFVPLDGDCACVPGEVASCSTGLQGACAAGASTCSASGTSSGPCMQSVLPSFDDCNTPADEDCDGSSPVCTGAPGFVKTFGVGNNDDVAFDVATDATGAFVVGGVTNADVDSNNNYSLFQGSLWLSKYDAGGGMVWQKVIGAVPSGISVVRGVATDAAGNVYAVGSYQGSLTFGNGVTIFGSMLGSNTDVFLVKFNAAGVAQWAKSFGSDQGQYGNGVAVDAMGNVFITGSMEGSANFGGSTLNASGGRDAFVAKFTPAGGHVWSKIAGGAGDQYGWELATTSSGDVVVVGYFFNSLNFGTQMSSSGNEDAFVVRLAGADGSQVWAKRFGDNEGQQAYGVAVDAQDNVYVAGSFQGDMDLGGAALSTSENNDNAFVVKLDSSGNHLWSKSFGDNNNAQVVTRIAVDGAGNAIVTGFFAGSIDLGGGNLTNMNNATADAFVAKLSTTGNHLWSRSAGGSEHQIGWSVAADAAGNAIVAGGFRSSLTFAPLATVNGLGGFDAFAVKLAP